jgi:hypothetical protein
VLWLATGVEEAEIEEKVLALSIFGVVEAEMTVEVIEDNAGDGRVATVTVAVVPTELADAEPSDEEANDAGLDDEVDNIGVETAQLDPGLQGWRPDKQQPLKPLFEHSWNT